jgi:hypothetical protein
VTQPFISYTTNSASGGFWWNGVWHEVRPSHGEDDGPPTGVREPRRPKTPAPSAGAAAIPEELVHA